MCNSRRSYIVWCMKNLGNVSDTQEERRSKAELSLPDSRGHYWFFHLPNQSDFLPFTLVSYLLFIKNLIIVLALRETEAIQVKMPRQRQPRPMSSPTTDSRYSPWCLKSPLLTKVVPHVSDFETNLSPHISIPENQGKEKHWVTLQSIWKSDLDYF